MLDQQLLQLIKLVVFDFDGVFTDNTVVVSQQGLESVRCWRSDGLGLARLKQIGVKQHIVSTENNLVVSLRAEKLKIPCQQGVKDKAVALSEICQSIDIPLAETMFVGNDINDIPAFKIVGLPVAVADAYPEVLPYVKFVTKRPGGLGAVREICDLLFFARQIAVVK